MMDLDFDIGLDKTLFYDWEGANEKIFSFINGIRGESYDLVMQLISQWSHPRNFQTYVYMLLAWSIINFIIIKFKKHPGAKFYAMRWMAVFCVLFVSVHLSSYITQEMKAYFGYPRPYAALGPQDVHVLEYRASHNSDDFKSFPSGHVAFAVAFIISLWPLFSDRMQIFGAMAIFLVAWSRMSIGMHFPADVLASVLLFVPMTNFIRHGIYSALRHFDIRC